MGERPDPIIGAPEWFEALGYGREEGCVLASDQLRLHRDHIHIGYMDRAGPATPDEPGRIIYGPWLSPPR
jgi:hypothetical protein